MTDVNVSYSEFDVAVARADVKQDERYTYDRVDKPVPSAISRPDTDSDAVGPLTEIPGRVDNTSNASLWFRTKHVENSKRNLRKRPKQCDAKQCAIRSSSYDMATLESTERRGAGVNRDNERCMTDFLIKLCSPNANASELHAKCSSYFYGEARRSTSRLLAGNLKITTVPDFQIFVELREVVEEKQSGPIRGGENIIGEMQTNSPVVIVIINEVMKILQGCTWQKHFLSNLMSFRILLVTSSGLGSILNGVAFCTLLFVNIGSELTTLLMRSQCIIGFYMCLMLLLCRLTDNSYPTSSLIANVILCYLWENDQPFWLGFILNIQNFVCASLDRFLAVLYPVAYKVHSRSLKIAAICYLVFMVLMLSLPKSLLHQYVNGTCGYQLPSDDVLYTWQKFFTFVWFFANYVLPFMVFLVSQSMVIHVIRKRMSHNQSDAQSDEAKRVRDGLRRLTLTTIFICITLLCCHSVEEITSLVTAFRSMEYLRKSVIQDIELALIMLGACIIPCILVVTISSVREFMWQTMCRLSDWFKEKRNSSARRS
ncbi:amine GPCR [Clonorchis sinensis]|uniref:Amine GPCR n=1 Tax=Clonorchis sinensis TaxID=79923 RepID=G7Y3Y3_CLOSI|nr:amine GPCR [Clonorchis sinensis]